LVIDKEMIPVISIFHNYIETWTRAECPMCAAKAPFSTAYGRGAEEFHKHGQPSD